MTVKQFFKSTAFKCIITLLCVLLVSGIFLTVMNGLLSVSDEERLSRAISKIYGKEVTVEEQPITTADVDNAIIKEAYLVTDDGNYLIKSTGKEGYQSGTVSCWVVVKIENKKVTGINKVTIDSYTAQTQMAEIKSSFLDKFSTGYKDGTDYTTDNGFFVGGSTMSSTAICNAVNGAITFVKVQILGETAKVNPYEGFNYTDRVNITAEYSKFEVNDDESVTFHIQTKSYGEAGSFKIDVTVGKDGLISAYNIISDGSTSGWDKVIPAKVKDGSMFIGKGLDFFTATYGANMKYTAITGATDDNVITGATSGQDETIAANSTYLCMYAGAFATSNYQNAIDKNNAEGGNE